MTIDASSYSYAATALDKVISDLKTRISTSAGNQKTVQDALAVAQAVLKVSSGNVKQSASILASKGEALLKIQADAEATAAALLAGANALKAKVATPLYSFLTTDSMAWGTRQGELLRSLVDETTALSRSMTTASARFAAQNSDMGVFVKEVNQLEKAAAGTGYLPQISSFIGGTIGAASGGLAKALWPLAVVAGVGGLVYLTAPQLLRRLK